MAKNGILPFFAFFKNVYSAYTPCFCCKGGSHPGKNPPIYTVLNAAFSCAKTLCRGSQCTTRARPSGETIFFQKKKIFYSSENFVLTKFLKKFLKKFFIFEKIFFGKKYFYKKFFGKKFFIYKFKIKFIFYLNKIYFYKIF